MSIVMTNSRVTEPVRFTLWWLQHRPTFQVVGREPVSLPVVWWKLASRESRGHTLPYCTAHTFCTICEGQVCRDTESQPWKRARRGDAFAQWGVLDQVAPPECWEPFLICQPVGSERFEDQSMCTYGGVCLKCCDQMCEVIHFFLSLPLYFIYLLYFFIYLDIVFVCYLFALTLYSFPCIHILLIYWC